MWWKRKTALFQEAQAQLRSRFLAAGTKVRQRCANYLHTKDAKLSIRQRKVYFGLFLLIFGGSSTYILVDTLMGDHPTSVFKIAPIKMPVMERRTIQPRFSSADTHHIRSFRLIIDSLQATPEGRQLLDAFYKDRPGFLDSFMIAEKMFR